MWDGLLKSDVRIAAGVNDRQSAGRHQEKHYGDSPEFTGSPLTKQQEVL